MINDNLLETKKNSPKFSRLRRISVINFTICILSDRKKFLYQMF